MDISRWLLTRGDELQVVLFFALLISLAAAERLRPRRRQSMARSVRWPTNFLLTLINLMVMGVLPVTFISAAQWSADQGWGLLNIVKTGSVVAAIVTLLVRAFISFGTHYVHHMVPFLWRIHRIHHLDTELDVSTTVRFHPLEFVVALIVGVPIIVVFGLTPAVLALYELLDVVVTLWSHSNTQVPARLERVLRVCIVTPDLHRIHHSTWKPETNSNFGAVLPVWDLIFGTFRARPRVDHETMPIGLDDVRGAAAHRPLWLLASVSHAQLAPEAQDLASGNPAASHAASPPAISLTRLKPPR